MRNNPYISYNASGGHIDYSDPQPEQISVEDIAMALSREARYNGQVGREHGYSVAQHSVLVSLLVPKEHALAGLFHDGSEAYLRDIATPAKRLLPDYRALEKKVLEAVYRAVGLPAVLDSLAQTEIRKADRIAMATEVAYLVPPEMVSLFNCCSHPIDSAVFARGILDPISPAEARSLFLARFESIMHNQRFRHEPILWMAQEYGIPQHNASMAASCLRSAVAFWSKGLEDFALEAASRMACFWPAPMPAVFRNTPLEAAFSEGAKVTNGPHWHVASYGTAADGNWAGVELHLEID